MITVRVPATSANLGPGFDALGLALRLHNTLTIGLASSPEIEIEGEGEETLPRDPSHLAYRAAMAVVARAEETPGTPPVRALRLTQRNAIPLGRGLGSSAAAIVGGAAAAPPTMAAALLPNPRPRGMALRWVRRSAGTDGAPGISSARATTAIAAR